MTAFADRVQNQLLGASSAMQRSGAFEHALLWTAAFTIFVLPEARLRIAGIPLEIAIAFGATFTLFRLFRTRLALSRPLLLAMLLFGFELYYYVLRWVAAPFPFAVWYFVVTGAAALVIAAMLASRLAQLPAGETILARCALIGVALHASVILLNALVPDLREFLLEVARIYTAASERSLGATASIYYEYGLEIYRATGLVGVPTVSNAITAMLGLTCLYLFARSGNLSLLYAAWLCAIAALISFSRGAMIGLAPALLLLTARSVRVRRQHAGATGWMSVPAAGLILVTFYWLVSQLSGDQADMLARRFGELFDLSVSESAIARSISYAQFFERIGENPFLLLSGTGLVQRYSAIAGFGPDLSPGFVSNGWILFLYEYGVMVFLPAVVLALGALRIVWRASRTDFLILASLFWMFASDNHIYLSASMTALWLTSVLFITLRATQALGARRARRRAVTATAA